MKIILKYIDGKNRIWTLVSAVLIIVQCYLELMIPDLVSRMTEKLQSDQVVLFEVVTPGLMMFGCAAMSFLLCLTTGFLIARMSSAMATGLRKAVFDKTLEFSLEEVSRFSAGSLITRCTQDILMIQTFFSSGLQLLIKAPFLAGIAIIKISGQRVEWTIATAVAVFAILIMMTVIIVVCSSKMAGMQRSIDGLNKRSREHISGLRVIRAFDTQEFHRNRFEEINSRYESLSRSNGRAMSLMLPGFVFIMYGLNLAIYLIGIVAVSETGLPQRASVYASMVAFSSYALQIVQAFICLVRAIMLMPRMTVSAKRVSGVLNTVPAIRDGKGVLPEEKGSIEFRNVSFKYPGSNEYALKDLSFSIKGGDTVAFIGQTGSGKTSVMNLIPRLYEATEGEVLVDGVNVKDYSIKTLRDRLGYVPQKSRLFTGTIAGNIAYGDNGRFNASLKEIEKAARVGQAKEFIEQREGAYDSEVTQGGSNFSGGQRQRLTISRAICRDPEIFLFDDSFSALDFMTDRTLRNELRKTAKGATVIIIAQRVGTIRKADRIYVLDRGRIVGEGTHEELLDTCEVYRDIVETQLSAQTG
ncbi:MAG: ABC transporter ATP-binding protein/permease [Lachnospiraceae bacterium]|nr:ABC transporter ATP-binding protein/permease [Lachnospiraceae bacterium]